MLDDCFRWTFLLCLMDCVTTGECAFSLRFNTKHFRPSPPLPSHPHPPPTSSTYRSVILQNAVWKKQNGNKKFWKVSFKNWRPWKDCKYTVIFHPWPAFDIHCLYYNNSSSHRTHTYNSIFFFFPSAFLCSMSSTCMIYNTYAN